MVESPSPVVEPPSPVVEPVETTLPASIRWLSQAALFAARNLVVEPVACTEFILRLSKGLSK